MNRISAVYGMDATSPNTLFVGNSLPIMRGMNTEGIWK